MWLLYIVRSLCSLVRLSVIFFLFVILYSAHVYIYRSSLLFSSRHYPISAKIESGYCIDFNVYTRINIRLVSTSLNLVARNSDVIYNQIPFSLAFTLISLYLSTACSFRTKLHTVVVLIKRAFITRTTFAIRQNEGGEGKKGGFLHLF